MVSAVLLMACSDNSAKTIPKQLDLGNKYLAELKYEEAIAIFENILKIDPKQENAYLGIAQAYIAMDEIDKAIAILEKGISQTGSKLLSETRESLSIEETTPNIEETEEQEPFIEASESDYDLLLEQMTTLVSFAYFGGLASEDIKANGDGFHWWLVNILYYYLDNVSSLPIRIHKVENVEEKDPREYFDSLSYMRAYASEVDWIAENVFNIKADTTQFSLENSKDELMELSEYDGFFYKEGGFYYNCSDSFDAPEIQRMSIVNSEQENGIYKIDIIGQSKSFGENYGITVTASLKEENGVKYWSFYKVFMNEELSRNASEAETQDNVSQCLEDVYGTYVGILRKKECYSMADDSYIVDFLDFGEEKEITTLGFDEDWNEAVYKVRIDGLVVHADGINLDSYMNKKIEVYGRVTEAATGGTIIQAERINVVN